MYYMLIHLLRHESGEIILPSTFLLVLNFSPGSQIRTENLQSLMRTERMMVRWMCGVSLKDRKRGVDLYSHLEIESVAEVVRRGRLRWFGPVERKSGDDWVSACRCRTVVVGMRCAGSGRKTGENV